MLRKSKLHICKPFVAVNSKIYCAKIFFYVNALFLVEVHVAIKLVLRHLTFNNLKEITWSSKKHD